MACVVGFPVKHSLSPLMHNAMYEKYNINGHYDAREISAGSQSEFEEEISALIEKGYINFNVTMPYKGNACLLCDELDDVAAKLGSVNTILMRDEKLYGYSTDGEGFVRSLETSGLNLNNCKVLIVGAGGAAISIADSLFGLGSKIYVTARRKEQAETIKDSISSQISVIDFEDRNNDIDSFDLIVNATSVGMSKDGKEDHSSPIDASKLKPSQIVVDTIYNPKETALLKAAKQAGCTTFNGLGMLAGQGEIAFELMTGVNIKHGDMYDVLLKNDD